MTRFMLSSAATLFSLVPGLAGANPEADEAIIKNIVQSVGTFADQGAFDTLETLFDEEVRVDYESLSGQPAALRSASALMTDWAGLLPGFDATRHELSDIRATVDGNDASASADVTATHWIKDADWAVDGHYDYQLVRQPDGWKITSMTFTLEDERGNRDLLGAAMEAAAANPNAYIRRQRAQAIVRQFLTGLEEIDMDTVNNVWADDAIQEMPFAPKGVGFPDRVVGKEALIQQYAGWPENAEGPDFTSELRFYSTLDPNMVIAEFRGDTFIRSTQRRYDQRYIGVFHVNDDGKIDLFREYFDPTVFVEAFDLTAQASFYAED
jgi:ketosteroid isomerase-like protein